VLFKVCQKAPMFGNCTMKKNNQQDDSHENHTTGRSRDGDYRLVAQTTSNCPSQKHGGRCHTGSNGKNLFNFEHPPLMYVRLVLEADFA